MKFYPNLLRHTFRFDVLFSLRVLISSNRRHIHLNPSQTHHLPGRNGSLGSANLIGMSFQRCSRGVWRWNVWMRVDLTRTAPESHRKRNCRVCGVCQRTHRLHHYVQNKQTKQINFVVQVSPRAHEISPPFQRRLVIFADRLVFISAASDRNFAKGIRKKLISFVVATVTGVKECLFFRRKPRTGSRTLWD